MKSICNLIAGTLLAINITACTTTPTVEPSNGSSSTTLNSIVDHTNDSIDAIKKDALDIKKTVKGIVADDNSASNRIDIKADNIIESAAAISKETDTLKDRTSEVSKLETSLSNLRIAMDGAKVAAMERLYGYITMFWVIGFVLIAAGAAVAFFLNKGYGGALVLLGALMLGFASASQRYMDEIAMVGAVLLIGAFVCAVGMIAWSTINSKRNSIAIREIVEMIEILKETMTEDEQKRIFGADGIAANLQSDLTKEIVAKIKEKNGFKKLEEEKKKAAAAASVSVPPTG
jgi:hypothetical protein